MTTTRRRFLLLGLASPWVMAACDAGGGGASTATPHPATPGTRDDTAPPGGSTSRPSSSSSADPSAAGPRPTSSGSRTSGPAGLSFGGPTGVRVLNVVAHPDDDLLFLSPDLGSSIQAGARLCTVFLTAGDAGQGAAYWQGRMKGICAAYARLAGAPDRWTPSGTGPDGATRLALTADPRISLVFLKLPDGGAGTGFRRYGRASLPRLWRGERSTVTAVDGSARYTRAGLETALTELMRDLRPDVVRTQDFLGRFGDGDHHDHHVAAYLTRAASRAYPGPHRLVAYQDYASAHRTANVPARLLKAKRAAFATYSRQDLEVFTRLTPAAGYKSGFEAWLRRQYILTVE